MRSPATLPGSPKSACRHRRRPGPSPATLRGGPRCLPRMSTPMAYIEAYDMSHDGSKILKSRLALTVHRETDKERERQREIASERVTKLQTLIAAKACTQTQRHAHLRMCANIHIHPLINIYIYICMYMFFARHIMHCTC